MSSAYHPQSDEQTERVNRVLKDMIRHYVNPVTDDWDEHLTPAEFFVNNAWHESIHSTPFRLKYGRDPVAPAGQQLAGAKNPRAVELTSGLAERLASAKSCMHAAQQRQIAYADQGRSESTFQVDDDVLLSTKNVRPGRPWRQEPDATLDRTIQDYQASQRCGRRAGTAQELAAA